MKNRTTDKNIIIFTGPISGGKTEAASIFCHLLKEDGATFKRFADGLYLLEAVKNAHGPDGKKLVANHYHKWNEKNPALPHNHTDLKTQPHFTFTIENNSAFMKEILATYVRAILNESEKENGLIIAEVATGIRHPDVEKTMVEHTAQIVIDGCKEANIWNKFKERVVMTIGVTSDWNKRIERNMERSHSSDGITKSWKVALHVLMITHEADCKTWQKEGLSLELVENNGTVDGLKNKIRDIYEGFKTINGTLKNS